MQRLFSLPLVIGAVFSLGLASVLAARESSDGWVPLFNGRDLSGWKVSTDNPGSITARDGMLVIDGPRAHAYYDGPVAQQDFRNFELKAKVKTRAGSNSGIYIHTAYQADGWPSKGYECQVNNSHVDPRKTGGLYGVQDNLEAVARDEEWFDYHIQVQGKRVVIRINGKVVTDYTEPENPAHLAKMPGRLLGHGTIALQAHDPKSVVFYKDIQIRVLD